MTDLATIRQHLAESIEFRLNLQKDFWEEIMRVSFPEREQNLSPRSYRERKVYNLSSVEEGLSSGCRRRGWGVK